MKSTEIVRLDFFDSENQLEISIRCADFQWNAIQFETTEVHRTTWAWYMQNIIDIA